MPFRKIINDSLHGFITIDDALIFRIMQHPYYQRLRRIKQMALAHLVYPGATHTRFQHSLGAYHLMCNALNELQDKGFVISPAEVQATKIAILLHDVGHGPFSHALEETIVHCNHEQISLLIMQKLNAEMDGALDLAIKIFKGETEKKFLHQLVSSQLDVDRLDYLARDSFHSGVSEGVIGYARIVKMLTVHNNELAVEEKGIHSIEKFLIARRLMYLQVYLHKTVVSAENLLILTLRRAKELTTQGHELFASPALQFFLKQLYTFNDFKHTPLCLEQFIELDDFDILGAIKVWSKHNDVTLSQLSLRLINRNLYKTIFSTTMLKQQLSEITQQVKAQFNVSDVELPYYVISNNTSNIMYTEGDNSIKILFKNGEIKLLQDVPDTLINNEIIEPVKKYFICYAR